jgi:hypothetical protein
MQNRIPKHYIGKVVTSLAMIHDKHLVIYWYSNGHKAEAINDKLKDDFGITAPPHSTVTYWCRKLKLKGGILVIRRRPGRPPEVDLDNVILGALKFGSEGDAHPSA